MLLTPRDFRGWLLLAALMPFALFVTYMTDPAVRRAAYWGGGWQHRPLSQRVGVLPDDAVESLRRELGGLRAASRVQPARNADYMVDDLRDAMESLPEAVARLVRNRLIGVYLVEGLGGANEEIMNLGLALEVSGFWRQHAGTVIFIDRDETDMRANMAMTTMEYMPSGDYRGVRVEARLARRGENDRRTTLRYVLLHELGHLIDYDRGITPWRFSYDADERAGCGFTCLSWEKRDRHRFSPRIDSAMRSVRSGNHEAYIKALPDTFRHLSDSNFPSLYATTMPEEDFAESFAQYVHSVLLGQPWALTLRVDGTIRGSLGSCFLERRCPGKKAYFDALLAEVGG